jgi:hypothetical protein
VAVFNLFAEQDWDETNDRAGYEHKSAVIGKRLGADLLGGTLYEVPPGEKTWPYHYELGCEGVARRRLRKAHPADTRG